MLDFTLSGLTKENRFKRWSWQQRNEPHVCRANVPERNFAEWSQDTKERKKQKDTKYQSQQNTKKHTSSLGRVCSSSASVDPVASRLRPSLTCIPRTCACRSSFCSRNRTFSCKSNLSCLTECHYKARNREILASKSDFSLREMSIAFLKNKLFSVVFPKVGGGLRQCNELPLLVWQCGFQVLVCVRREYPSETAREDEIALRTPPCSCAALAIPFPTHPTAARNGRNAKHQVNALFDISHWNFHPSISRTHPV